MLVTVFSSQVLAAITINSIDETRVSNVTGLGTSDVTVLGGTAGACVKDLHASDTTCTSCIKTGGTNTGLLPCNDRRINPDLVLRITITSDSLASGYPAMVVTPTDGIAQKIPSVTVPSAVSKGSPGVIEVKWSEICNRMTVGSTSGTFDSPCLLSTKGDYAIANATIGFKVTNDGNAFASGDDTATIKIKLVAEPATTQYLATIGSNGITYFEVTSGDQKGTLSTLSCTPGSGFPSSQNIRLQWVRVLFEKRPDESTTAWNLINRGSPHTDLEISKTGTCDGGNLDLTPIAFTGGTTVDSSGNLSTVDIENATENFKPIYDVKVAVVDEARNTYLYTHSDNDQDCGDKQESRAQDPSCKPNCIYECHSIRPAPVAGVLANKVNCFVATAAFGSPMASEVDTFRHFRDTYLIPTKLGFEFVRWYYEHGPAYAKFIAKSETYRAVARGFLWLPLQFAKISLNYGIVAGLSFLFAIFFAPLALLAWTLKRRRSSDVIF